MFSNLMASLQGRASVDEADGPGHGIHRQRSNESQLGFSLWGVAEAVANSVKETANDIVSSVQDTDWKSELAMFSKTVQDDTLEFGIRTVRAVETLPDGGLSIPGFQSYRSDHDRPGDMGSSISRLGKGILSSTKGVLQQAIDAIETDKKTPYSKGSLSSGPHALSSAKYSRMEAEVNRMQRDSSTYCDEPEDEEDFQSWSSSFDIIKQKRVINELVRSNAFMAELQGRIVPTIVEYDVFWTRYYYRLQKLEDKHRQQKRISERTTQLHQEEAQVSWDDSYEIDEEFDAETPRKEKKSARNILRQRGAQSSDQNKTAAPSKSADLTKETQETKEEVDEKESTQIESLPVSTSADRLHPQEQPLVDAMATIPAVSGSSSGQTSDESPSARVKTATESDTLELESTSDGSGNREWCVLSPKQTPDSSTLSTNHTESVPANPHSEENEDDAEESDVDDDWGNWD